MKKKSKGAGEITPDADLTWLLNRAAQGLRAIMDAVCASHRIQKRDYVVLTALATLPEMTQLALAQALSLDKTTLTLELDRLEKLGLVVRRAAPNDRRARLPAATEKGRATQAKVAAALVDAEAHLLAEHTAKARRLFREMLCSVIASTTTVTGSCL